MTKHVPPDLLDLAEAVARGELLAADAERQVRAALGSDRADTAERAIRELRGLIVAAGAVRVHARATHEGFASQSLELVHAAQSTGTVVPGQVRGGSVRRSRPRADARPPRRTLLLVFATIAVGAGVIGASYVGSRLIAPNPAPTNPNQIAVASISPAPSELPTVEPSAVATETLSPVGTPSPGALIAFIRTTDKPDNANCLGYDPPPNCPTGRLWIVGSDGTGAHELFPDGFGWQSLFGWSPDGTRLLYTDQGGIFLTDLSGGAPQPVDMGCVEPCRRDESLALSSDGRHLVFLRSSADAEGYYDGPAVIATMDLASGEVMELSSTAQAGGSLPGWSPDGTQIVFSTYGDKDMGITGPIPPKVAAVFVVDVDGQNLRQISPPDLDSESAVWSPDGSGIVFMSTGGDQQDIYTIRPDGTDLRRLTSDGVSANATWTPDGRILFVRSSGFWTMDADGTNAAELVSGSVIGAGPTDFQFGRPLWQPTGGAAIVPPPWNPSTGTLIGPPPPTPVATTAPVLAQGFSWTGSLPATTDLNTTDTATDTATVLADGRVLITTACDPVAQLYDPRTGTFSPTAPMTVTRGRASATRLRDGRVLIAGGGSCGTPENDGIWASAETYDPTTGTFSPTGSMVTPRAGHTATLLADGRVLIAGGMTGAPPPVAFQVVLASYQGGHPAAVPGTNMLASAEVYDPTTGTFSPTGSMNLFRRGHTATLLQDGRVLVVGGGGEGFDLATAELYDPTSGAFSATGSMAKARWLHTATLLQDGRVLITGGRSPNDATYASAELFDPSSGKFSSAGSMDASRQQHTATLLQDGRVLIAGGYFQSPRTWDVLSATEVYDPATGNFTPVGSMGAAREGQTATLLNDGRVLIAGGTGIGTDGLVSLTSAVLYQP